MSKKKNKGLLIAGAVLGSATFASIASYFTTKYLVQAAVDRQMPKLYKLAEKQFAGSEANKHFLQKMQEASENLDRLPTEPVEITSHDGIRLMGHWYPCKNAKRVVIAMHGWRSSWQKDFGLVVDFLHRNNCSILFAEQRGQNNSDGEYISFGLHERYDCLSWTEWVNEGHRGQLPVYLMGVSMGATTVLMATGLNLPDYVHGVIADCGFTSPKAIWKHVANNNLHITYSLTGLFADEFFKQKLNMSTSEYSTLEALKDNKLPILFIHGTEDKFVPVSMTYENYLACNAPKHLAIFPGADHGMSYYFDASRYESEVISFWKKYDK